MVYINYAERNFQRFIASGPVPSAVVVILSTDPSWPLLVELRGADEEVCDVCGKKTDALRPFDL